MYNVSNERIIFFHALYIKLKKATICVVYGSLLGATVTAAALGFKNR